MNIYTCTYGKLFPCLSIRYRMLYLARMYSSIFRASALTPRSMLRDVTRCDTSSTSLCIHPSTRPDKSDTHLTCTACVKVSRAYRCRPAVVEGLTSSKYSRKRWLSRSKMRLNTSCKYTDKL